MYSYFSEKGKMFSRLRSSFRVKFNSVSTFQQPLSCASLTGPMLTLFSLSILIGFLSLVSIFLDSQKIARNNSLKPASDLNTTVVILNWSRPSNVNKIASEICENLFEDVINSVIIWNNDPKPISFENNFANTSCPESRVQIINSPENLYFQARYMACAQATTPYCFIQDDDYLILPEIIRALVHRINENSTSIPSIHLQPPHEMLSSELRTIILNETVHTTFAWLGYGTILKRSRAIDFLSLLGKLDLSDDQHKMADNYFTILSNEIPERWFDAGIELGGGQAFTVGLEGEARNNRHIVEATKILESIKSMDNVARRPLPYVNFRTHSGSPPPPTPARAPCHGRLCIFETSARLLSGSIYDIASSSISDILGVEKRRLEELGERRVANYLRFAPSNAVDGIRGTVFRNAKQGEWVMLDLTQCHFYDKLQLVLEVDEQMEAILHRSVYETSEDGANWHAWNQRMGFASHVWEESEASPSGTLKVISYAISAVNVRARYLRMRLLEDVDQKWAIHEVYLNSA